ncbi:MAG: hypothetical protein Q4B95_01245 [Lonepinella koalarum]|nr:hypothetical protein [Lonepinella koalarum]
MNQKEIIKQEQQALLENACSSLQLGIDDYLLSEENKNRRLSSVRNFISGLLLLYKYKLFIESKGDDPYEFIRARRNNSTSRPVHTVNVKDIKSKLSFLNITINENLLDSVISARNNLEHFFLPEETNPIEIIHQSYILLSEFFIQYLSELGTLEEFISSTYYKTLLDIDEAYKEIEKQCQNSLNKIDDYPTYDVEDVLLENARCPFCKSSLIKYEDGNYPNLKFSCYGCNKGKYLDIYELLGITHRVIRQGGDIRSICYDEDCGDVNVIDGVCFTCGYKHDPNRDYESEARLKYLANKDD